MSRKNPVNLRELKIMLKSTHFHKLILLFFALFLVIGTVVDSSGDIQKTNETVSHIQIGAEDGFCVPRWTYRYENADIKLIYATEAAIEEWEKALGNETLFTYSKHSENTIGYGDIESFGLTNWKENYYGELFKFRITIAENAPLHITVLHELGHSMGMEHSENPTDIMYKSAKKVQSKSISLNDIAEANKGFDECISLLKDDFKN